MDFTLFRHYQHSKKCKDGKKRNYLIYFLNNIEILKQKMPYDENYDYGFQFRTYISNEYLLNGNLHQTRRYIRGPWWRALTPKMDGKIRHVKYPISRKILNKLNVPKDLRIDIIHNT